MTKVHDETLCWRCKRPGTRTCSWDDSKGNIPVEGWTAEEVPYMSWCEDKATTTFRVIGCPLFDPEENYEERRKHCCGEVYQDSEPRKYAKREEIEHFIHYGWTDLAIALKYKLSPETIKKYRRQWRKKQEERKGEKK